MTLDPEQWARYQRQISVIGAEAQQRLCRANVMVIGLGGLGVPAITQLAMSGVASLVINDYDVVELSNLSRQHLYQPSDIMQAKVKVCARALRAMRPDLQVVEIDQCLTLETLIQHMQTVDAVLDCTDNFASRFAINQAAYQAQTPLISASAVARSGQLISFDFSRHRAPCYRCLFDELDQEESDCNRAGILAPVLGVMASMQAMAAIDLIGERHDDPKVWFYRYRAEDHSVSRAQLLPDANCPVCAGD